MQRTVFRTQVIIQAVGVGALFFLYFLVFRSINIAAVDGSVRMFPVLQESKPFLHGNNHLLYPVHIYYFANLLSSLGVALDPPLAAFRAVTILNASLAAGSLAIFFILLSSLGITSRWCTFAVLLLGFSQSFIVNATNPNEPMPGFFLSMLAAFSFTQGVLHRRWFMHVLAGLLLGWAMATYQSMIIVAVPFALIAAWEVWQRQSLRSFSAVITFSLSVLLGVFLAFGLSYVVFSDLDSVQGLIARFFTLEGRDKGVWGRFTLTSLILMPLGITAAFFELPFFGLRRTFFPLSTQLDNLLIWLLPAITMLVVLLVLCAALRQIPRPWPKRLISAFVCLPFLFFLPYWWAPFYSKLWLQPLAVLAAALAFIFAEVEVLEAKSRRRYYAVALGFIVLVGAWNSIQLAVKNATPRVEHSISEQLNQRVEENAVVFVEWTSIAAYFSSLNPGKREFHDIPILATELPQEEVIAEIDQIIQDALDRGIPIYFLGVVDISEETWGLFYGEFLQIDWVALEKYRKRVSKLETYRTATEEVGLFRLR